MEKVISKNSIYAMRSFDNDVITVEIGGYQFSENFGDVKSRVEQYRSGKYNIEYDVYPDNIDYDKITSETPKTTPKEILRIYVESLPQ